MFTPDTLSAPPFMAVGARPAGAYVELLVGNAGVGLSPRSAWELAVQLVASAEDAEDEDF
jgi:hypothetical protein